MLIQPIIDKLNAMKLTAMAQAFAEQMQRPDLASLTFEERFGLLVDQQMTELENRRMQNRLKNAKLRLSASIEDLDFMESRNMNRAQIMSLAQNQWVTSRHNILITGPTGAGKSYLACALAQKACRDGHTTLYQRLPRLLQDISIARHDGRYQKLMAQIAKCEVLVLDDLLISPLSQDDQRELLEIVEERYDRKATIITSQLPIKAWHDAMQDPTLADAILDRLVHNAYKGKLGTLPMGKLGTLPIFLLLMEISDGTISPMPRIARIIAPGYPHHITQRGNNRAMVFFDDEDRQTYLKLLEGYTQKHHVQIWAYCLMNNHIHLLAVPETETSLSRGIGLANQMYTQYLNQKLKQSGRIWQNRFFSCVVGNEQYLWAVARYIERNPVKAGFATNVEGYRWSSAKAHVIDALDPLLAADSWLSPQERNAYREFVTFEDEETDSAIRKATKSGRPFGSESFVDMLEFRLNQALKPKKPGRPKKKTGECP